MLVKPVIRAGAIAVVAALLAACGQAPGLAPLPGDATILAFGDSLTYGTGAGEGEAYPSALAAMTGLTVINAGVPGEMSAEGRARLPQALDTYDPDLVVLVHGGNDTLRRISADVTRANLEVMIMASRDSGAQVVMLGVPGRNFRLAAAPYYEEIADSLRVPINTSIIPSLMRDESMKSDAVHFTGEGYRAMAEAVYDLLRDEGALF